MNFTSILFSKQNIAFPFEIVQEGKNISIADQKARIIAISIFVGIFTMGIGGVLTFYYLTARYKWQVLHPDESEKNCFFSLFTKVNNFTKQTLLKIDVDPKTIISNGYGDYIVYKKGKDGEKVFIGQDSYNQVYPVLLKYSCSSFEKTNDKEQWIERFRKREDAILSEIKNIDPDLTITFLPSVLRQLMLVRECIEEDNREESLCEIFQPGTVSILHYPRFGLPRGFNEEQTLEAQKELKNDLKKRNCWHLCFFNDAGNQDCNEVKETAFKLNQVATEKLAGHSDFLRYEDISRLLENEIDFFKSHYAKGLQDSEKERRDLMRKASHGSNPGPFINFGSENNLSCAIRNEEDAQLMRNIAALECSEDAKSHVFIYRGAEGEDFPYCLDKPDKPYAISYGSHFMDGSVFDPKASSIHYAMKRNLKAFAIKIPYEDLEESPFDVPSEGDICGAFGKGEVFHARTRAWEGVTEIPERIMDGEKRWEHLKSSIPRNKFLEKFDYYNSNNKIYIK
ncbi:MAG: hypothetical protein Tsb0021_00850 [Chlamydiales bacterium]